MALTTLITSWHFVLSVITNTLRLVMRNAKSIATAAVALLLDRKHARYGLSVTRMLLGVTVLGWTLTNFGTRQYTFGGGMAWTGQIEFPSSDFAKFPPFSWIVEAAPNGIALTSVFLVVVVLALLLIVGYRTRLTLVVLMVFWVGLLAINPTVQDQSDNLTRIAMTSLLFASPAEVWSLDARRRRRRRTGEHAGALSRTSAGQGFVPEWLSNCMHNCAVVVIGAQLCMVYASGGLYKAQGAPWYNGYAIYNAINVPQFGTWPEISALISVWGPVVAIGTIGTVLFQAAFPVMLVNSWTRRIALIVILSFHLAIAVVMGLPWFSLAMVAMDAVFITDGTYRRVAYSLKHAWREARSKKRSQSNPSRASETRSELSI
ncbi:putative membrane protein YphA (DoxX/SURF4 family) [Microbacterium natoriense]|uniref:Membrane protein YphA (DoxX/SURF4 family) n=1 Tax=Microbacterium natoriense TaxID=284570 RepID=A0AAW8EUU5_9MICO|nr:HTTM domain-containing protein [Microbacterium natoriense]MDQ0647263.1 putative membrane protein YphA (DoxX/SURF4 family) [Microbacterium natoriense]